MSQDEAKKRRYSEKEFALILRKASEIQEAPGDPRGRGSGGGFTLEEIRSIAGEAGIDPKAVSRAAALLGALEGTEKPGVAAAIVGGPAIYHLDFEVEGQLPPEEMGRILEVIRKEAAHQGTAAEVLGGMEWKTVGDVSGISVNISPRGDSTSIQIVGDRSGVAALSVFFSILGPAFASGVLGSILEPTTAVGIISMVGGLLAGGLLSGRTLWVWRGRRFHAKLSRLMERLAGEVERRTLPPAPGEVLPPRGGER